METEAPLSMRVYADNSVLPLVSLLQSCGCNGAATMASNSTGRAPMFTNKRGLSRVGNGKCRSAVWVKGLELRDTRFDEKALAVFQTDTLIPDQFHATYQSKACLAPEKSLMLAVLHDAIICFQDNVKADNKRKRTLFLEAEEWILREDSFYLFSFESICASLGLDARYLRQGLMQWKAAALANSPWSKRAS
jgi:hypothetical protein